MVNRREFVRGSVAATFLPALAGVLGPGAAAAAGGRGYYLPLHRVVFDRRYAEAREFAARASGFGASVHPVAGDVTALWYRDLDPRWRRGPAAIAGLTDESALFCLQELAWGAARMRVVFRADHRPAGSAGVAHRVSAGAGLQAEVPDLGTAGRAWSRRLAEMMTHIPEGLVQGPAAVTRCRASASDNPPQLVSWVIAPVARG